MTILNDTRLHDYKKAVAELGKAEGEGKNAKPAYAEKTVALSHEGVIVTKDAEEIWGIYDKAAAKAKGSERDRLSNDDTRKVRTSETRKLIGFGKLLEMETEVVADDGSVTKEKESPVSVFARAVAVINSDRAKDIDGSTYQLLVKFAGKQIDRPKLAMTDDEILECLSSTTDKKVKDELARLKAILKSMDRLHNGSKQDPDDKYPSDELAAAMTMLEGRIGVLEFIAAQDKVTKLGKNVASKLFAPAPGMPVAAE